METIKNILKHIAVAIVLIIGLSACSSDDDDVVTDPDTPSSEDISKTLSQVSTEWGLSQSKVKNLMKSYNVVENKDTTLLQFQAKKSQITIVYKFASDALAATVIRAKSNDEDFNLTEILSGFTSIGSTGSNEIYTNNTTNVFAVTYTTTIEDEDYQIIGFTPLHAMTATVGGHEYADLGLGRKWATCNIGASTPSESGGYYAWGETAEKDTYTWDTYKYCNGTSGSCESLGDSISGTRYDVATAKWGSAWQTPTKQEFGRLSSCTWVWTQVDGVNGYKLFGPNGNYIFLPAAGYKSKAALSGSGTTGYYMSCNEVPSTISNAYYKTFTSSSQKNYNTYKYYGFTVRAVVND